MAPETLPLEPDPEQARVLDHARGTLLVTGPPGSGKTTLLRERFARLVENGAAPERVALFALNRRAARESREWLLSRLRRSMPDLPAYTVHGFAFRLVGRRFRELGYDRPPQILSAPEQYSVVRRMLLDESPGAWPRFGGLLGVRGFAREVADFCLRAQERLLDRDDLDAAVERSASGEYREIAAFYRRYLDGLAESGQCDFAGLLLQVAGLLKRGMGEEDRFEHVLVDDYQDATLATEGIVRALGAAADSMVVAADPNGHVFSYRGGTLEPLRRGREALAASDEVVLTRSHRLGGGAAALASLDDGSSPAAAEPPRSFEARVFAHPGEEVDAVAHALLRFRVDDDVPWERMAVIVRRYGEYLSALRHALSRHRIPFIVVAEASAVAAEPANRPVIDLFRYVFRDSATRAELLDRVLTSPIIGLDPHGLRRLRREARVRDVPLIELVEGDRLDELPGDLRAALERLRTLVDEMPAVAGKRGADGLFFWLWSGSSAREQFGELVASEERSRDLDALAALGDVLSNFAERRPGSTILDYLDTLEAAEFGPDPWVLPEERHPRAVRIVSAHRAHGTEVDVALVVGCLEGEFPSLAHGYPMVDVESLLVPRTARERMAERLAEERALFRLAVSRARRRTLLFASRSTSARNPRTPSRFAGKLALEWAQPEEVAPAASLRSMEAGLRRRLAGRVATGERLAALTVLPRVGADPGSWWGTREWSSGAPLYAEDKELLTSYSRLSSLENCALQYLYATEMGLDPDETYQMWMGSLVHRLIDRCQRGEIDRTVEALHAALEEAWKPAVFPNRAIEHRRFLDAKEMLRRWHDNESPDIERSEVKFRFPIDGALLRGRIDAVFRMQNGHLRVVDYKTSRYAPTKEEAQNDLQLAAYYLALKRDPELSGLGEPGYLELAYIGKPHFRSGFVKREVAPRKVEGYEAWADGRLKELLARVRSEDFSPTPEADCTFCRFKTICPVWPEGAEVQL